MPRQDDDDAQRLHATYTHATMPDGSHKCLRAGNICGRNLPVHKSYGLARRTSGNGRKNGQRHFISHLHVD